jgi:hypothetical protein
MIRRMPGRLGWGSWGMSDADREDLKLFGAALAIQARMVYEMAGESEPLVEMARFMHEASERVWNILAPASSRDEERDAALATLIESLRECCEEDSPSPSPVTERETPSGVLLAPRQEEPSGSPGEPE